MTKPTDQNSIHVALTLINVAFLAARFNSQLPDILIISYENNPFCVVSLNAAIIKNVI
jgi:hypothetical protein